LNDSEEHLTISEKIKNVVSKYYVIAIFEESSYLFEPVCIIKLDQSASTALVEDVNSAFKEIGYQVKFHKLSGYDKVKYNLPEELLTTYYKLGFEAKVFRKEKVKIKKNRLIQLALLVITSGMILLSAFFYIYRIEPYYSGFGKSVISTTISVISFCIGMFLIVIVHEYGHIYFTRKYKLETSHPYLIPGPPPIGMLGAFVSIKDDPHTRNQKFDVAIGGIVTGVLISILLVIIGLLLSNQADITTYLQSRADYFGSTLEEEAEFVKEHLNFYNFIFLGLRSLLFEMPSYGTFYGFYLPESLLIIHPLAFTGWIGLCLSALNLIPIPFLDGGHVLKAIFPHPATKFIGIIVGFVIFIFLDPYLISFSTFPIILLCCLQMLSFQAIKGKNKEETPFPMIPLTRNRKIFALSLLFMFIILFPLSYDNLFYGIGF